MQPRREPLVELGRWANRRGVALTALIGTLSMLPMMVGPFLSGDTAGLVGVGLFFSALALGGAIWWIRTAPDRAYPDLGSARRAWQAIGAGETELVRLNGAHRQQRELAAAVVFRTGHGPAMPLADAYAICRTVSWRSGWLVDRHLAIDPVAEATAIVDYATRVGRLRREAQWRMLAVHRESATARRYLDYDLELRGALGHVARRAAALRAYRLQVERLDLVLADQRSFAATEWFGERVRDLVAETAAHDVGRRYLDDSGAQLAAIESELRVVTAVLGQGAGRPLRLAV